VEVQAGGFQPGEQAEIHLHSDPVLLDTVTADASGAVRATVTIPADTPAGAHTVVITGLESGHTASAALTVSAATTSASGPAAVTDGSLSWGVLASFRSYISGSIAQGSWQTSGGATDSDGVFTFPVSSGSYDADGDVLSASFAGAVRFTGHDMGSGPLLDLTISGLRVQASGDSGALYGDVRSRDMNDPSTWLQVSGVHLADLDLSGASLQPVDGRISLRDVPVTLTGDGAAGFAGFYQAGQQMDPLDLTLAVDGATNAGTGGSGNGAGGSDLASTGVPTGSLVALAVALLLVGGLALLAVRRRTVPRRLH
jgi:LPXTG-motif cell wall-anchored protein